MLVFSMEKVVGPAPESSVRRLFTINKYELNLSVEKSLPVRKKNFLRCFLPIKQAFFLHKVVVLHYTHHINMACLINRGGGCKNAQK